MTCFSELQRFRARAPGEKFPAPRTKIPAEMCPKMAPVGFEDLPEPAKRLKGVCTRQSKPKA